MISMIPLDDFKKMDIRICSVLRAGEVPDSDKLLELTLDCGEGEPRTVVSGIKEYVSADTLIGKQYPFIINLEPRRLRGTISNGMLLAASAGGVFALLSTDSPVPPGTRVS